MESVISSYSDLVHYSGNLQIAASVFTTLGLCLLISLTIFTSLPNHSSWNTQTQESVSSNTETPTEPKTASTRHGNHNKTSKTVSSGVRYLVILLSFSLYTSAALQMLAQFFAILGLTLNATPTPAQATQNGTGNFGASSWIMDRALTQFATVAWTSSLTCAMLVDYVYHKP